MSHISPIDPLEFDSHSAEYLESLLAEFEHDASGIPQNWQRVFQQFAPAGSSSGRAPRTAGAKPTANGKPFSAAPSESAAAGGNQSLQFRADRLVRAYRRGGHRAASLDPLELAVRDLSVVDPARFSLESADDSRQIVWNSANRDGEQSITLRQLRTRLNEAYCGGIGFEYMHIGDSQRRRWLLNRIEQTTERDVLTPATERQIFERLNEAAIFEEFMRKRYVGAKTFSLEGAETLIPLLDLALDEAAASGIVEVVLGMAHRGRLNVLANIVGKPPVDIFREFEDVHPEWYRGRGDVKYHLGASGDRKTTNGANLHVSLCFNPSHLEFINPVALGRMRAKQQRISDSEHEHGMTVLIHGDAAFAGEGIIQETLNLSPLDSYDTGGTLHIIINNQLGFTTSPHEARSTQYASDIAKAYDIPIFHVNGEDLPAIVRVVRLAMDYRAEFGRDCLIDLICYRRWGHNEADEPSFTQPLMYEAIENRPSIRQIYLNQLEKTEAITHEEADQMESERREWLREQYEEAQEVASHPPDSPPAGDWEPYTGGPEPQEDCETAIDKSQLQTLLQKLTELPDGFQRHPKLKRSFAHRAAMAKGEESLDWAAAEALAIATLAIEGHPVRMAGQDTERGTFSHRHAVLTDVADGSKLSIFSGLSKDQAPVEIINSPLSEVGALGFEYGYSLDYPEALVAWEAQYGDFANVAQVIIDQFIASAEDKWRRLSGVVLLLPHGYEGKGPEHSSARLDRFLSLTAEDNIQVVVPSTPAQYFHLLRRQVKRSWRKPLIVMTPKSLLRSPQATSSLEELSDGRFQVIIGDERLDAGKTSCILITSGKLYYELANYREERQRSDFAIIRIEQLYPIDGEDVAAALAPFKAETPVRWVQEEPFNLGPYHYWKGLCGDRLINRHPLSYLARPMSASPATGSSAAHKAEQQDLLERAFEPPR